MYPSAGINAANAAAIAARHPVSFHFILKKMLIIQTV